MIRVSTIPIPIPSAVADLMAGQLPERVVTAAVAAEVHAYNVTICRGPRYAEAREYELGNLARENKILAAHDPAFVVRGAA